MSDKELSALETDGTLTLKLADGPFELNAEDVLIQTSDIPGMAVASDRGVTLAVDLTLSPELLSEGLAREAINRLQNLRKDSGLAITDRIDVCANGAEAVLAAMETHRHVIMDEVLANALTLTDAFCSEDQGWHRLDSSLEGHEMTFYLRRA